MPNHVNAQSSTPLLETAGIISQSVNLDDSTVQLVQTIVQAADERKGADLSLLQVTEISTLADYFVIITGFSKVQVRAIARSIEEAVEETLQLRPIHAEGLTEGTWVLLDYGDVIVHIQLPQERDFYNLEAFWGHAERLDVAALLA